MLQTPLFAYGRPPAVPLALCYQNHRVSAGHWLLSPHIIRDGRLSGHSVDRRNFREYRDLRAALRPVTINGSVPRDAVVEPLWLRNEIDGSAAA